MKLLAPLLLFLSAADPRIPSDLQRPAIQRLMAGFITQFPAYVTWPESAFEEHPDTLYVGLIGDNPLGAAGQEYLEGRPYRGRTYAVRQLTDEELKPETLRGYQMLVFGSLDQDQLKKLLKMVKGHPVLTIGETSDFLLSGGIVQFNVQGNAVTFTVSYRNAQGSGLTLDPRLLTLGMIM
ncbi:MAG: YfiR family protein [Parachlamydiales bacterium]